jgi:hypothetical protein
MQCLSCMCGCLFDIVCYLFCLVIFALLALQLYTVYILPYV